MKGRLMRLVPFFLFLLLALFLWRGLSLEPQKLPSAQLGQSLPNFRLPLLGNQDNTLTPLRFHGRITLLNVWASWCAACVEEQVFLMQLAQQGVFMVGINYKDSQQEAEQWLQRWGNPYQFVGEDTTGKLAIDLGVYGAPETFLIDAQGIIRYRHVGVLDEASWKHDFIPRIHQLEQTSASESS